MMNRVILAGRLGHKPEIEYTASGKARCKMSIATDTWSRAKNETVTDWHKVVAWDHEAQNCVRFLDKGRVVLVDGRLRWSNYKDKTGADRTWVEVVAHRVTFMPDGKGRSAGYAASGGASKSKTSGAKARGPLSEPAAGPSAYTKDDDLPF